jgi:flagellar hook-associated protein 2
MSTSPTIFNGSSRYSADFQAVVERTVNIASLPMTQMQSVLSTLGSQSSSLSSLDSRVVTLQSAITTLSSGLGLSSYATTVSDPLVVSAATTDGVREGTYSIEVTDFGSYANAASKSSGTGVQSVTSPSTQNISADTSFQLYLNTADPNAAISFTPAANTLNALADAINAAAPGVHASVVNVGSAESQDYRLSIQSNQFGANTIDLKDSAGNSLLDQPLAGAGTPVKYKANGGAEVTSTTRTATLTTGLTVNLLKASASGVATTVNVTRTANNISNALSSFVTAYNAVVSEVDKNRGSGAGALQGDSVLSSVNDVLHQIVSYDNGSGGALSSLAELGVVFDTTSYKLTFDSSVFSKATTANLAGLSSFLGSVTGGGFLKTATDLMSTLEDPTSGIVKAEMLSYQTQISNQNIKISAEQNRIDQLRTDTQTRMAAADALIASMEQQATYFTNMFESMRTSSYNN